MIVLFVRVWSHHTCLVQEVAVDLGAVQRSVGYLHFDEMALFKSMNQFPPSFPSVIPSAVCASVIQDEHAFFFCSFFICKKTDMMMALKVKKIPVSIKKGNMGFMVG